VFFTFQFFQYYKMSDGYSLYIYIGFTNYKRFDKLRHGLSGSNSKLQHGCLIYLRVNHSKHKTMKKKQEDYKAVNTAKAEYMRMVDACRIAVSTG